MDPDFDQHPKMHACTCICIQAEASSQHLEVTTHAFAGALELWRWPHGKRECPSMRMRCGYMCMHHA